MTSILEQSFGDFELIVSDHSSTDGSWDLLQPFANDSRVRLHQIPTGGGAARNWNFVTDQARGDYVKLVCGDDLLYRDCLARQVASLDGNAEAGVSVVRRDLVDVVDRILLAGRGLGPLRGLVPGRDAIRAIVRAGTNLLGEPMCVLLRADVLRKVGGWQPTYPFLIDQYTYMRALESSDLIALDETLAAFRISSTQWSVHLAREQGSQAAGVHREFRADLPTVISSRDEFFGTLRAHRTAWARRAAYFVWRKRISNAA